MDDGFSKIYMAEFNETWHNNYVEGAVNAHGSFFNWIIHRPLVVDWSPAMIYKSMVGWARDVSTICEHWAAYCPDAALRRCCSMRQAASGQYAARCSQMALASLARPMIL